MNISNINYTRKDSESINPMPERKLEYSPFTNHDREFLRNHKSRSNSWLQKAFNYRFDKEFIEVKKNEIM